MEFSPEEALFLKDLVKSSRQRTHHVPWVDRDGSQRMTVFRPEEFARICAIGRRLHLSPAEILRQAAHIPVRRPPAQPREGMPAE